MFSWDRRKAILNLKKHGISFQEAATVFVDLDGIDFEDPEHSITEQRAKRLGQSLNGKVLLVIYTQRRDDNGKEKIRIISARQASRKERKAYFGL